MSVDSEKLLKLVNSSGFPFQLAIADRIRKLDPAFGWQLVAQEYAWKTANDTGQGFIDIVIRNQDFDRMVIECKRVRDANWVFLVPNGLGSRPGTVSRMFYVDAPINASSEGIKIGWHNFYTQPQSIISEFCIVRGTGEGQKPMLENLCDVLLKSLECLALEELSFALRGKTGLSCSYVPVIVTNAELHLCRFSSPSVSLSLGEVSDSEFESVPYIRFSKSLTTDSRHDRPLLNVSVASRERQRTVFVVQSTHLQSFLENWHVPNTRENQQPWR